jgi:adenosylhomocysteine nucleosidase
MKTWMMAGARLLALMMLGLLGCTDSEPGPKTPPPEPREVPRIAVVTAYAPELEALLPGLEVQTTEELNGRTFHLGRLAGKDVVLFLSGVSTVNAAMTVQLALARYKVTHVVFSGIAGGVNPALNIGDVTVPRQWANYQEQSFARQVGPDMWQLQAFHTRELGHYGMAFPQYMEVVRKGGTPDVPENKFWFDVDPRMLAVASGLASKLQLERCTASGVCLEKEPLLRVGGRGVSGSTFVDNADYRAWVWNNFQDGNGSGVDALDMESSAVAMVAYSNGVPFIAFRSLSDLAGGGTGANEISTFFQLAARNSALVVRSFLESL